MARPECTRIPNVTRYRRAGGVHPSSPRVDTPISREDLFQSAESRDRLPKAWGGLNVSKLWYGALVRVPRGWLRGPHKSTAGGGLIMEGKATVANPACRFGERKFRERKFPEKRERFLREKVEERAGKNLFFFRNTLKKTQFECKYRADRNGIIFVHRELLGSETERSVSRQKFPAHPCL